MRPRRNSAQASPPANRIRSDKPKKHYPRCERSGRLPLTISGAAALLAGLGISNLHGLTGCGSSPKAIRSSTSLPGEIAISPTGQHGQWFGTLNLPKVRIPLRE